MVKYDDKNFELDVAQKTLITLYGYSLKLDEKDRKKSQPFNIYLGDASDLHDGTINDRFLELQKRIFNRLKKENVVAKFSGPAWEEEYPGYDGEGNCFCYIHGEYYPEKILSLLENIWKPKKELTENMLSLYRKFITLVQNHFANPISGNDPRAEQHNRKANEIFFQLSTKIIKTFRELDFSLIKTDQKFKSGPYIPFTSLFSALKELKQKRMTLGDVLANMTAFYGKLTELDDSFKIETYEEKEFDVEEFAGHLKNSETAENSSPKQSKNDDNAKNKINSILLITPKYANFDYFWVVFNHDYENKHRVSMKHKHNGSNSGNGYNLWLLYSEKSVEQDASFLNYMNDKIFNVKAFQKFAKTKLVKIKKRKIMLNDGITLEKESKENLDKDILRHLS